MTEKHDIARIIEQEHRLVFDQFDAEMALAVGLDIKMLAAERGQTVAIDVQLWDRVLFRFAMEGTTNDNAHWIRRKVNGVRRFHKSSYRMMLERGGENIMHAHWGLDSADYVFAGGGFPIKVKGAGCIGAITVSGLTGREDHSLVVEAVCAALGVEYDDFGLSEIWCGRLSSGLYQPEHQP